MCTFANLKSTTRRCELSDDDFLCNDDSLRFFSIDRCSHALTGFQEDIERGHLFINLCVPHHP